MRIFLGLDVGTQGARALVCRAPDAGDGSPARDKGQVLAQASRPFPPGTVVADLPDGYAEQAPAGWWQAAAECLRRVVARVPPGAIHALSVTSTSGTLCLLDAGGQPLIPALMYNDARAREEAAEVQAAGAALAGRLGYRFNPSFALAKLLWLARRCPEVLERTCYVAHAADFIVGQLSGAYGVTDFSNALKTGFDLSPRPEGGFADCWPAFIAEKLALPVDKLPRVVAPGEVIGAVTAEAAGATGLRPGTPVVAGMTDGCAGQVAAGAVAPGDWNSTLGTTLVVKGVTRRLLCDPQGRIYSHRHPDGYWLPGGASNTGGELLAARFPTADLVALDRRAAALAPTGLIAYPLARRGERFPFVQPDAEGFVVPFGPGRGTGSAGEESLYAAYLEGVAYVERLAYETLEALGATVGPVIRAAGGAARSQAGLQKPADGRNPGLLRPAETGAAMGAAILAASRTRYDGVISAAREMVQVERRVSPRESNLAEYEERYRRFCEECAGRGYV
jgi:xylulokinase